MAAIRVITIKNIINLGVYDENEQIVILSGDDEDCTIQYKGKMCNIPDDFMEKSVHKISAMGESRKEKYRLNKYGWTEIWLD